MNSTHMHTDDMFERNMRAAIAGFVETNKMNLIGEDYAIYPELAGVRMFEKPLIGIADARDSLFTAEFKKETVIGPHYRSPEEWLPGARSVISFFLPFTQLLRDSNRPLVDEPYDPENTNQHCSAAWLHGRFEGQDFIGTLCKHIEGILKKEGFHAVAPSVSPDFAMDGYTPNWSERHAGYAAGLGTFGLSKGLITEKGMAGRMGSVITDAVMPPTERTYHSPFEYCLMCGACQHRCPVHAIDINRGYALGKDNNVCGPHVWNVLKPHGIHQVVRYGCGKCQVSVPCETKIPEIIKRK